MTVVVLSMSSPMYFRMKEMTRAVMVVREAMVVRQRSTSSDVLVCYMSIL